MFYIHIIIIVNEITTIIVLQKYRNQESYQQRNWMKETVMGKTSQQRWHCCCLCSQVNGLKTLWRWDQLLHRSHVRGAYQLPRSTVELDRTYVRLDRTSSVAQLSGILALSLSITTSRLVTSVWLLPTFWSYVGVTFLVVTKEFIFSVIIYLGATDGSDLISNWQFLSGMFVHSELYSGKQVIL